VKVGAHRLDRLARQSSSALASHSAPVGVLGVIWLAVALVASPPLAGAAVSTVEATGSLSYDPVPPTNVVETISSNVVSMSFPPAGGPFAGKASLRLIHDVPSRGCRFTSGHDWDFNGTYNAATRGFRGTYVERAEATSGACTGFSFARTFNPDTGPFQAVLNPPTGELTSQIPPLKFTLHVDPALVAPPATGPGGPPNPGDTFTTTAGPGTTTGSPRTTQSPITTPAPGSVSAGVDPVLIAIVAVILLLVAAALGLVLRGRRGAVSAGPSPGVGAVDIERQAAEEIARDEARSADWESPKNGGGGVTHLTSAGRRP
jgi:hypothetical protein